MEILGQTFRCSLSPGRHSAYSLELPPEGCGINTWSHQALTTVDGWGFILHPAELASLPHSPSALFSTTRAWLHTVTLVMSDSVIPRTTYLVVQGLAWLPARLLCPKIFQARTLERVAISFSRDLPPGDQTPFLTSPAWALAGRFFTTSAICSPPHT